MKYNLRNKYKVEVVKQKLEELIKKEAVVELREVKLKRNLDQNGLYWLWLTCLQEETKEDKNDFHLKYRALLLLKEEEYITNIIRPDLWAKIKIKIDNFEYFKGLEQIVDVISESTTSRDEGQFSEYLNSIQKHARANFGVILLTKKDENFEEFYREYGFK